MKISAHVIYGRPLNTNKHEKWTHSSYYKENLLQFCYELYKYLKVHTYLAYNYLLYLFRIIFQDEIQKLLPVFR